MLHATPSITSVRLPAWMRHLAYRVISKRPRVWKQLFGVKRIRNNPTVQIAPSTHLGGPLGTGIAGSARILPVGEQQAAEQLMDRKYRWQKRMFALIWRLQRREQVYIAITPTQA